MARLFADLAKKLWEPSATDARGSNTPVQSVFLNGWSAGWRDDIPDTQMEPNMLSDVLNVEFSKDGILKKRAGYTEITGAVTNLTVADHVFALPIYTTSGLFPNFSQQILHFNENDGELFYQSFGELAVEYAVPATGTDLVDSGYGMGPASPSAVNIFRVHPIVAVPVGDAIYITTLRYGATKTTTTYQDTTASEQETAGSSKPLLYDVQAGTFTRLVVHQLDGTTGGIPRARCGLYKYGRLFWGNLHSGGTYRWPSRVYWSDLDASSEPLLTTYKSTDWINVGGDDASEITHMAGFGEQIIIFKNTSIYSLGGTDGSDFTLHSLEQNLGTEATNCVIQHGGLLYFYDYRSGIWAYDGARFNLLSEPINSELLTDVNKYAAFKATSWEHNNKLYFSFPVGAVSATPSDDNTRTYVWDTEMKTWTKYSYGAVEGFSYRTDYSQSAGVIPSDTDMYIASPNGVEGIYVVDPTVFNDAGAAINAYFTTGWLNPGDSDDRTRLRRLQTVFGSKTAGDDITITVYRDFDETTPWMTITASPTGDTVYDFHDSVTDVGFFSWLKLKFSNAVADEEMEVRGVGLSMSVKGNRRGQQYGSNYSA